VQQPLTVGFPVVDTLSPHSLNAHFGTEEVAPFAYLVSRLPPTPKLVSPNQFNCPTLYINELSPLIFSLSLSFLLLGEYYYHDDDDCSLPLKAPSEWARDIIIKGKRGKGYSSNRRQDGFCNN